MQSLALRARTGKALSTQKQPAAAHRRPVVMSPAAISAPAAEYGYVMASVAASAALVQWQAIRVGMARRKFGVPYPKMYAEDSQAHAQEFNCVQRAHQNTLETLAPVLVMECLLGLQHPLTAASLGMIWNIGRVVYTLGYSTGDPNKRLPGIAIAGLTYLVMIIATCVTGIRATGLLGA